MSRPHYFAPGQAYALTMRGNQHLRSARLVSEDVVTLIIVAMLTSMTIVLSGAPSIAVKLLAALV